jgi:hypothetical protein
MRVRRLGWRKNFSDVEGRYLPFLQRSRLARAIPARTLPMASTRDQRSERKPSLNHASWLITIQTSRAERITKAVTVRLHKRKLSARE